MEVLFSHVFWGDSTSSEFFPTACQEEKQTPLTAWNTSTLCVSGGLGQLEAESMTVVPGISSLGDTTDIAVWEHSCDVPHGGSACHHTPQMHPQL